MTPKRPKNISVYAETCLLALSSQGLGAKLSLGGAFGLAYYLEYRSTRDVDAWWDSSTSEEDRKRIVTCLETALSRFGEVRTRAWGDVVSVDLLVGGKAVFSFQVAHRSGQLEASGKAPWPPDLLLDSLPDLVAAKMVALIERGAPRDFLDIHAVCRAGLVDPGLCWRLWRERRRLAGDETPASRARLALLTHLGRIELHRPLTRIADADERARADRLRAWFRKDFLDALVD